VVLAPGRDERVRAGHLWIYRTEIARIDGTSEDGGPVIVTTATGRVLGTGLLNTRSQIAVRLLAQDDCDLTPAFFRARLESALSLRRRITAGTTACRLVFSEGDFLPGLIVDRYGGVLVMQTLTLGMDRRKEMLAHLLSDLVHPQGIYARNDPAVRLQEGLPREKGWVVGEGPTEVEIEEDGLAFLVDVERGQKTGFFLDQRENRLRVADLAQDGDVLDCFAYTGAWGIHAARGGARDVTGIEISEDAVALAMRNAARNSVADRCRFVRENGFDGLRRLVREGARYDLAILDPPAFAPSRRALAGGRAGYKEINLRALKLLRPGGWLLTCSCSHHIDEVRLREIVLEAARDAGRTLRLVESRFQARDHPVHPAMPETRYLTCLVFVVE
jgi:23S rRNA (cytosine1962-C5)-methyltransferase